MRIQKTYVKEDHEYTDLSAISKLYLQLPSSSYKFFVLIDGERESFCSTVLTENFTILNLNAWNLDLAQFSNFVMFFWWFVGISIFCQDKTLKKAIFPFFLIKFFENSFWTIMIFIIPFNSMRNLTWNFLTI